MHPYQQRLAAAGASGVAAIGVAQEVAPVWTGYQRESHSNIPQFTFAKANRRVTCFYFYVWDTDFGPGFIKICSYFPYPIKVWVNGHEWAKQQARSAGIGFTELSNGFATCTDPQALQAICDQLGSAQIQALVDRWLNILPTPLSEVDEVGGYWWEFSMRQIEVSHTLVFDAPRHARSFVEALISDNLDLGRPDTIEVIFGHQIRTGPKRSTPGVFKTSSHPKRDLHVLVVHADLRERRGRARPWRLAGCGYAGFIPGSCRQECTRRAHGVRRLDVVAGARRARRSPTWLGSSASRRG
jgi:hypothetical protein